MGSYKFPGKSIGVLNAENHSTQLALYNYTCIRYNNSSSYCILAVIEVTELGMDGIRSGWDFGMGNPDLTLTSTNHSS